MRRHRIGSGRWVERAFLVAVLVASVGCEIVPSLFEHTFYCDESTPCAAGFECDEAQQICVAKGSAPVDAGAPDADTQQHDAGDIGVEDAEAEVADTEEVDSSDLADTTPEVSDDIAEDVPALPPELHVEKVALSMGNFACALRADSTLWCWGSGTLGQLGDDKATSSLSPVQVFLEDVVDVALGSTFACAVTKNEEIACWGQDHYFDEIPWTDGDAHSPLVYPSNVGFKAVAAAGDQACAIQTNSLVLCWGGAPFLGKKEPYQVTKADGLPLTSVVEICLTESFKVALLDDGSVLKWGSNPEPVLDIFSAPLEGITQISCGDNSACVRKDDGTAYCFGNKAEQIHSDVFSTPFEDIRGIYVGKSHTCLITDSLGEVYCWGTHLSGELGTLYVTEPEGVPQKVDGIQGALGISAGAQATCAWFETGVLRCWGLNTYGQLGLGVTVGLEALPVQVPNLSTVVALSVGGSAACAISDEGTLCWGQGDTLGYGAGTVLASPSADAPVALNEGPGATPAVLKKIALGSDFGCGIDEADQALCWGKNDSGKLGDGGTTSRAWAAPVLFEDGKPLTGVTSIAAGTNHACAVDGDGDVLCWGSNASGQTGHPDGASKTPVGVLREEGGPLTGATGVWAGYGFTCAIAGEEGSVYCWGNNDYGQSGDNPDLQNIPHAHQVWRTDEDVAPGLAMTDMAELALGYRHACGHTTDGQSVWCWGHGSWGALGNGISNTGKQAQGFAVQGLDQITVAGIAAGDQYACVLTANPKKAYCWGRNELGQLGQGGTYYWESTGPVAGGAVEFVEITAGNLTTCAIDVDGGVWCWGAGGGGLLGDGTFATHKPTTVEGLDGESL